MAKVPSSRKRGIFRQIKERNRKNIGNISRISRRSAGGKDPFSAGVTFATGCYVAVFGLALLVRGLYLLELQDTPLLTAQICMVPDVSQLK